MGTLQLDLLESIALIQTILYLVCGVLFESQPRFNTQEYTGLVEQDLLSAVALFYTMAILGLGIVLIWHEINDVHDSNTCGARFPSFPPSLRARPSPADAPRIT